ncbi:MULTISPECIES: helix-turn-helix domain-containing protein [Mycobacteroides]|uniref:Helix-turn-helix domain-containing protein n=1 Tax=Mycobacteroides immunogenum TaxID=83262 RepID=A0A7V8LL06_9MYCO|nr:hypothetical protein AN909_22615 [Mycobacteroides immunogenum]MBN7380477.1 helix-turn-helix domain-containing protein [Mycobacteroides abscessus subsp. massiliense]RIU10840.1 DNA-binding protein [Mycobacteroides abscessus]KPG05300.1 hypothetical protein AN908_22965 [Mycobacteroides immunogenum]KPG06149.1 hypothetical protein AN910_22355 [Mycobacteroides immunogenum]
MRTHSVEEASAILGAPSVRWVTEQLRAGRLRGYKVGRHWRMTDEDIAASIEIMRPVGRRSSVSVPIGAALTPTSRRRVVSILQATRMSHGPNRR